MDDLVAFLRARLDEEEAAAKLAAAVSHAARWVISEVNDDGTRDVYPANDDLAWVAGHIAGGDAMHIARHDPARVLREVEAKRAILEIHKVYSEPEIQNIDHIDKKWNMGWVERAETGHAVYWCEECDHDRDYDHISSRQEGCRTLRALAAVYSDHPGYRQEWAP